MPERKNTPFVITLTGILLAMYLFAPQQAFIGNPLVCHFHHANIFHLAANVLCLYMLAPCPMKMLSVYPLAVAATFASPQPVLGISGMLYAYIGIGFFRSNVSIEGWIAFIAANLMTLFIPGIAFAMHAASFVSGVTVAVIIKKHEDKRACTRKQ